MLRYANQIQGPFASEEQAQKFSQTWAMEERDCRRSHPRKGAERVGRRLACDSGVKFLERWSFTDKLIDLNSYEGMIFHVEKAFLSVFKILKICGSHSSL